MSVRASSSDFLRPRDPRAALLPQHTKGEAAQQTGVEQDKKPPQQELPSVKRNHPVPPPEACLPQDFMAAAGLTAETAALLFRRESERVRRPIQEGPKSPAAAAAAAAADKQQQEQQGKKQQQQQDIVGKKREQRGKQPQQAQKQTQQQKPQKQPPKQQPQQQPQQQHQLSKRRTKAGGCSVSQHVLAYADTCWQQRKDFYKQEGRHKAWPPHTSMMPFELDMQLRRKRAHLVHEARKELGEPSVDEELEEPQVSKLLQLAVLQGQLVTFADAPRFTAPFSEACGVIEKGRIRCLGDGCSFEGHASQFATHLGLNCRPGAGLTELVWLQEVKLSLKDLARHCSVMDLQQATCIYCHYELDWEDTSKLKRRSSGTAALEAAAAAAAAAGDGQEEGLAGDAPEWDNGKVVLPLYACSTCPASVHQRCYKVWTRELVDEEDDNWQCLSCRQGASCAASGCLWCSQQQPHLSCCRGSACTRRRCDKCDQQQLQHLRGFNMDTLWEELRQDMISGRAAATAAEAAAAERVKVATAKAAAKLAGSKRSTALPARAPAVTGAKRAGSGAGSGGAAADSRGDHCLGDGSDSSGGSDSISGCPVVVRSSGSGVFCVDSMPLQRTGSVKRARRQGATPPPAAEAAAEAEAVPETGMGACMDLDLTNATEGAADQSMSEGHEHAAAAAVESAQLPSNTQQQAEQQTLPTQALQQQQHVGGVAASTEQQQQQHQYDTPAGGWVLPEWSSAAAAEAALLKELTRARAPYGLLQQLRQALRPLLVLPETHADVVQLSSNYNWLRTCVEYQQEEHFRQGVQELLSDAQRPLAGRT